MLRDRLRWAAASSGQPVACAPEGRAQPRRASPSRGSGRDRPRAAQELPRATNPRSRIAVRVGRGVSALEVDLVGALLKLGEESILQAETAAGLGIDEGGPALDTFGVELLLPARVQRVGQIDSLAIATDLDHLRPAVQRPAVGVGGFANDAAKVNASRLLGFEGIADVVLEELAGTPCRHV